jgi:hypothetical protein
VDIGKVMRCVRRQLRATETYVLCVILCVIFSYIQTVVIRGYRESNEVC